MDNADVGMIERRGCLRLVDEAVDGFLILR
jgi:hypothetical protein